MSDPLWGGEFSGCARNKMTIRSKVTAALLAVVVLAVMQGLVGWWYSSANEPGLPHVHQITLRKLLVADEMLNLESDLEALLLAASEMRSTPAAFRAQGNALLRQFRDHLTTVLAVDAQDLEPSGFKGERAAERTQVTGLNEAEAALHPIELKWIECGSLIDQATEQAIELCSASILPALRDGLRVPITAYRKTLQSELEREIQEIVQQTRRSRRLLLTSTSLLMLGLVGFAFLIGKSILPPLRQISGFSGEIEGQPRHRLQFERKDEFGQLAAMFNQAVEALEATSQSKVELEQAVRQRTDELERFFANSADAMCVGNFQGGLVRVNPAFVGLLGYTEAELLALPPEQNVHPDDAPIMREALRQLAAGEVEVAAFEVRGRVKDGSWRRLSWKCVAAPELKQIYGTARDVTELRRATEALRESEENLATTLNSIGDGVLVTDADARITRLNPVAEALTGWSSAEASGRAVDEVFRIFNEETRQPAVVPVAEVITKGKVVGLANHTVLLKRDGREHPIADSCAPIRDASGKVIGTVLVFRDVTDERMAAERLRESETMLRMLANNLPSGATYRLLRRDDGSACFKYISDGIERLTGVPVARILTDPEALFGLIHEEEREGIITTGNQAQRNLSQFDCQTRLRTVAGEVRWIHWRSQPHSLGSGETAWDGLIVDITPLKQAENELRQLNEKLEATVRQRTAALSESDRRHRTLLANLQGMAYRCRNDHDWSMEYMSEGCRALLGIEPEDFTSGKTVYANLIHPEDRQPVWDEVQVAIAKRRSFTLEYRLQHANGEWRWVWEQGRAVYDEQGQVEGLEGFISDVSERKRAANAIFEQERRLSSLFRALPAGVGVARQRVFTEVNQRVCEMSGFSLEELIGQSTRVLYASEEEFESAGRGLYARMQEHGIGEVESRWRRKSGEVFHVLISASVLDPADPMAITFAVKDITERKLREQEMGRLNRLYAALSEVNQAVVRAQSRQEVFEKVCNAALTYGGFRAAWVGWLDRETQAVMPVASGGELGEVLREFRVFADERPEGRGPTGTAIREGRTVVCNQLAQDPSTIPWHTLAEKYGVGSAASFPIRIGNETRGALVLYASGPNFFRSREIMLLEEAASDVSFALNVLESNAQRNHAEAALRESVRQLEESRRIARLGTYVFDATTGLWSSSEILDGIFGISKESAFTGDVEAWLQIVHPADREVMLHHFKEEVIGAGRPFDREYRIVRLNDKQERWVHGLGKLEMDDDGRVVRMVGTIQDITERKQVEEALRQQEARLNSLFRALPAGVGVARDRVFTEVNERLCEMTGYTKAEILGKNARVLYASDEDFEHGGRELYGALGGRNIGRSECRWKRKNGEVFNVLIHASALESSEPSAITFTVTDITELKLAEARIRTLSQAVEQSPVSVIITDPRGRIEYVNPRFTQLTGYTATEVRGRNPRFLKSGETANEEYARMWQTITRGDSWRGQFHNRKKNGQLYWEIVSISPIRDDRGVVTHFLAVKEDITERRETLERIREQAALLDQTKDGILVVGMENRIGYFNRSAGQLYQEHKGQLSGAHADVVLFSGQPGRCEEARKVALEKGEWSGEIRHKSQKGDSQIIQSRWTVVRNIAGQPQAFLVINTDVTEKKSLEQQFLRSQRMESLGTLASGVAHDLNNVLAPILVTIELLRPLARDNDDKELLTMLEKGVHRGAGIIRQLLTFGRGVEGQRGEIQPRILLKEMAKIIQETFPKSVVFAPEIPADLWHINADATQVHQVLLNLCVNARDAMPQGGRLILAAENLVLDELYAEGNSEAKPGSYVVLQVSDTGTGIPAELLDKIFDPFFTTKPPGKGTGLGLSTVLGIVKSHGGFVEVFSRPGEGTQFKVYFPALQQSPPMPSAASPQQLPRGNGELILVVDDEDAIRSIARRMLEKSGYRVLMANNGAEGVVAFSQHKSEIQVVLTDMVMPVMDGASLIRVLRGYSETVKIVAMSGLTAQEAEASNPGHPADAFLHKPFTLDRLLTTLGRLLARPQ